MGLGWRLCERNPYVASLTKLPLTLKIYHYSYVTWAQQRLRSPANRLFIQPYRAVTISQNSLIVGFHSVWQIRYQCNYIFSIVLQFSRCLSSTVAKPLQNFKTLKAHNLVGIDIPQDLTIGPLIGYWNGRQGPVSISYKMSYRKISRSLKATRLVI